MLKLNFTTRSSSCFLPALMACVLLTMVTFHGFSQEKSGQQRLSVKGKDISLQQVFQLIKKQTGLTVFYTNMILNDQEKVSLSFDKAPLDQVLSFLLKGRNINYEIRRDKVIVLEKRIEASTASVASSDKLVVKGTVTDEKGLPLPRVSVKQKGAPKGVASDVDGNYTITVTGTQPRIVFQSVGYDLQDIAVNGRTSINAILKEKISGLDEVVVIGYGTSTRRDLTGSVGSANIADMDKAPVRSFEEALAGRVAGVDVSSPDGQPGSSANIVIRGNNSITQDNSPLYVIDGFPIENPDNNALNPADIESLEVLKDASATAIYGARGANGVIMITTKRGKVGEPVIAYNGYYGFQKVNKYMEMMSPYEFVKLQREVNATAAIRNYGPEDQDVNKYLNTTGINWQDEVYRSAPMVNNYLSLTGGTAKTKYALSGSVLNQDGIILNTGFDRYQGRVVIDQTVNDKFKVGVNLNYTGASSYGVLASSSFGNLSSVSLISSLWAYRPVTGKVDPVTGLLDNEDLLEDLIDDVIDENADYRTNPVLAANNTYNKLTTNTFISNIYAEYLFSKSLKLRVTGGLNRASTRRDVFYNSLTQQGSLLSAVSKGGPNGSISTGQVDNFVNENTLTYTKKINKYHNINIVGGFTYQQTTGNTFGASSLLVPNEELGIYGLDEGSPNTLQSAYSTNKLASFLGRAMYNYKSKYYATASFRADGSSRFGPGNQWSYFPSASLAWRLSGEEFMKNIKFISEAKLRVGYGVTGNNRVTDFASLAVQSMPSWAAYAFNNSISQGSVLTVLSNPNLRWESTGQFDTGLDLNFLKDRIQFTADYYVKKTYDLLLNADLPGSVGLLNTFKNIGEVQNKGLEFTLNTTNVNTPKFKWTSSFNISFNRNKVLSLTENQESITTDVSWDNNFRMPLFIAKKGEPIAQFYGYVWEGVYPKTDFNYSPSGVAVLKDDVATNGSSRNLIKPGDIKYRDLNGDGILNSDDYTRIGTPYPLHVGGFTNNFNYKGVELNVFFQWSYGNDVYNANRQFFDGSSTIRPNQNQFASYVDRWSETNQESKNFRYGGQGPHAYSSRVVEDGSYLRLKTVSLGYNIPPKYLKAAKLKAVRVYTSAQNIYVWTNYSGPDPEVSTRRSALTTGFDFSPYPRALTLTFGLNASL